MGKLVVSEFISLDGVIEDPGGSEGYAHGGWTFRFPAPDSEQYKFEELQSAEVQLLGRVTYDHFAEAWPAMEAETGEFGAKMNGMPKVVVSTTVTDPAWKNTTAINENVAEEIASLKDRTEGDILVAGSSQLVQYLQANGLVDEYRLIVYPVILGSGKRLFGDGPAPSDLRLIESRHLGPDVLLLVYRPAGQD